MATETDRGLALYHVTSPNPFLSTQSYFQINHWMINVFKFHYKLSV